MIWWSKQRREGAAKVTGDLSGIMSTGAFTTNVQQNVHEQVVLPAIALRPVTEVDPPPRLRNVPTRAELFTGRGRELAMLAKGQPAAQVLHGLGGVGKSTLAARYAVGHAEANPVWWISAGSPQSIESGLADLAAGLQPELARAVPTEGLAERAAQWLAVHEGWLLILDDVTDPAHIEPILTRVGEGQVIITSRLREGWHRIASSVLHLDILSEDESVTLLSSVAASHAGPMELDGARELCRELGFLPLAVEQAGAYLHQTRLSPRAYLDLLSSDPGELLDQAADGTDGRRTIARLWRVTLDRLGDTPLAGRVLRVIAWYAAEEVPRLLLDGLDKPPKVQQALGRLAAYNMVTIADDTGAVSVHPLVQAVARVEDPEDPHRQVDDIGEAHLKAVVLLYEVASGLAPDEPSSWPLLRTLMPHVQAAVFDHGTLGKVDGIGHLLNWAGSYFMIHGPGDLAIVYLDRAVSDNERNLGPDDPDTLHSRVLLADAHESAGDLPSAISLYEEALAEHERVLGIDNAATLRLRSNLAQAYGKASDRRTIALTEQVAADSVRILGADALNTLGAQGNLAHLYLSLGDLDRALPLARRTHADCERVLGPDHHFTLTARWTLANALAETGDLEQGIGLLEQTAAELDRVLGSIHDDSLQAWSDLAELQAARGEFETAVALLRRVLAKLERSRGTDHPITTATRAVLAGVLVEGGRLDEALPLYEQAVDDRAALLGAEHFQTMELRVQWAVACGLAGENQRAVALFEQNARLTEQAMGPDHRDALKRRHDLALACQELGDLDQALVLLEQSAADYERVLGGDDPSTLAVGVHLAIAYGEAGNTGLAATMLEDSLARQRELLPADNTDLHATRTNLHATREILIELLEATGEHDRLIAVHLELVAASEAEEGPEHPATLAYRTNLAAAYIDANAPEEAKRMCQQIVPDCERVLGPDHLNTIAARFNYSIALAETGDLHQALSLCERALTGLSSVLGPEHEDTRKAQEKLKEIRDAAKGRSPEGNSLEEPA